MNAAVQVDQLVVQLGGRSILNDLVGYAGTGEVTAVLGPNGAGKTTLLRCCTGLVQPQAGTVRVLGGEPRAMATSGRIGVMPQSAGAWSGIRAGELLRYLASLYASALPVGPLMERLLITGVEHTPYRRLSGGQQQAVNLAGALIGRPELFFLDEPTAGMDPHARHNTWELITELRVAGVSVLVTTHAMDEAEQLADRIIIIDQGRTVLAGTVAELTADGSTLEQVFLRVTTRPAA
ncbi:MAG: ABC transporter ATP-binding protein [Propionibacteriaceae bacterium]